MKLPWRSGKRPISSGAADCTDGPSGNPRLTISEVDARVDDETAASSDRGGDTAEGVYTVDVHVGISEVRAIKNIDRVDSEFELLFLLEPEALDDIHVEAEVARPFHGGISQRPNLAGLWIHQNELAIGSDDRPVAVARVQTGVSTDVTNALSDSFGRAVADP